MQRIELLNSSKVYKDIDLAKKNKIDKDDNIQKSCFKDELVNEIKEIVSEKKPDAKSTELLKFSKHAMDRISSRGINLTEAEISNLSKALNKADSKGIKDSLVMLNDTAFIVSVRNKTVITAISKENFQESIITNIDGAVIL